MAVLALGTTAVPEASLAAERDKPPAAERFEPGKIDRTPRGAPVPHDAPAGVRGAINSALGREVAERRSERSQTVLKDDGTYESRFYDLPINFQDAHGAWQPIDNTLVPSAEAGVALRNAANRFSASLPTDLATGGVQVTAGDRSVELFLRGGKGAPRPAPGDGTKATYADAVPGTAVSYTATNEGIKEELVLAGPQSPTSYDFTVRLTPGLSATETADGGIALVDEAGARWAAMLPPFVHDASWPASGEAGYSTTAVSLKVVATAPELVVRLAIDPAWLAGRSWPVTIDPSVAFYTGQTTYVVNTSPDLNLAGSQVISGGTNGVRRVLYQSDRGFNTFFDEPVDVLGAWVQLHSVFDTTGAPAEPVSVHPLTADWLAQEATWNQRRAGLRWATPGGDFVAAPVSVTPDITGPAGVRSFDIGSLMQAWADGDRPDHGVVVKYQNEISGPRHQFGATSEGELLPRFVANWLPVEAGRQPYRYETFSLGERRQASVNVASGNLTIAERDMGITGTGLDATVDRYYVSRLSATGSAGVRWRMWPQSGEGLAIYANGDVVWAGGPSQRLHFRRNLDGSFRSPPGYRATMANNPDGSYTLSLHESGIRYDFSAGGYVSAIVDRNGNRITFGYTYNPTTAVYDMVSLTDTQGRVTAFERAAGKEVTKVIDPAGRTSAYGYTADANGNPLLTSYTDPAGKVTRYEYDAGLYLTKLTDPVGNVTTFTYVRRPAATNRSSFWDGSRVLSSMTRVTDPLAGTGPTWRFDYSTPFQTKVTDPNARTTTHHFDRKGRVTRVLDALGQEASSTYSSTSFVTSVTDPLRATASFAYDGRDNLTAATAPTGAAHRFTYDDAAHPFYPTSATSPSGSRLAYTYDGPGNLTTSQNGLATGENQLRRTYNPNGTVATETDALGRVTSYSYDAKGNLTGIAPPAPLGATSIAYDGLSRVTAVTDGKGQRRSYAYDALDRLLSVTFADSKAVSYTYDAAGNVTQRVDPVSTTTYAYDRLNRPVSKSADAATFSVSYDPAGNVASTNDFGGTVSYAYDALNRLTTLTEPGGRATTFGYDAASRRTSVAYPNGVVQTIAYDASGRQTRVSAKGPGGATLTDFAYSYRSAGGADSHLRSSLTEPAGTTTYSYDVVDRLTGAEGPAGTYAYTYDPVGNRSSATVNGARTDATYNAADQLTKAGNTTYSHDANGNLTGSSAGLALTYNAADQTTRMKLPGLLAPNLDMTYHDVGQFERRRAGGTNFHDDFRGVAVIQEGLLSNTFVTRDDRGNLVGLRTGGGSHYYLFDGLGSVVAVTDASGNVRNRYAYDPYGNRIASGTTEGVTNPFQYTAGYRDTTGFYKFGTRYYDPSVGRWTQQDPSGQDANPYAYVGCNPVNFTDPDGLKKKGLGDKLKCAGGELVPNPFSASEGSLVEAGAAVAVAGIKGGGAAVAIGGSAAAATALAAPIVIIGAGAAIYGAKKIADKCF